MTTEALDKAVSIIGSMQVLADLLGVTKGAVGQWKLEGRRIPAEHCPAIERFTDGAVRCEELRPDVDWAYLRNSKVNPKSDSSAAPDGHEAERNGGMRIPMHVERVK